MNTVVLGFSTFVRKPVRSAAASDSAAAAWSVCGVLARVRNIFTPR